jgi:molecular chaperone GrpE
MTENENKNDNNEPIQGIYQGNAENIANTDLDHEVNNNLCIKELREFEDKYIRLLAEFENYKKRIEREKIDQIKYALEEFTNELLPFLDNLDRALSAAKTSKDIDNLIEGLEISISGYLKTLERFGVKCYVPDGQTFDPFYHEALTTICNNDLEDNTVFETMLKGFTLHERVIRPALVVVSKKS